MTETEQKIKELEAKLLTTRKTMAKMQKSLGPLFDDARRYRIVKEKAVYGSLHFESGDYIDAGEVGQWDKIIDKNYRGTITPE